MVRIIQRSKDYFGVRHYRVKAAQGRGANTNCEAECCISAGASGVTPKRLPHWPMKCVVIVRTSSDWPCGVTLTPRHVPLVKTG